jgi:hypothetical protein
VVSIVAIKNNNYLHAAITNHRSRRGPDILVREVIRIGKERDPAQRTIDFITVVLQAWCIIVSRSHSRRSPSRAGPLPCRSLRSS